MNLAETTRLLAVVRACWPGMTLAAGTADVWQMVLADLPADECEAAVERLARMGGRIPAAGDVRREVAVCWGMLAPPEAEAWADATSVAVREGVGLSVLHPAVRQAYRAMGGAAGPLCSDAGTTTRAQFRDTYRQKATDFDRDMLATCKLGMELEAAMQPRPITAAWLGLEDEPELPPDPAGVARVQRLVAGRFTMPDGA